MTAGYRNFKTYQDENHNARPKELFLRIGDVLENYSPPGGASARCLDAGCATGSLLQYLATRFPTWTFEGFDISPSLIELARARVPAAVFRVASVLDFPAEADAFDVVLNTGVLGIFDEDDARLMISNLAARTTPEGVVVVVANFNEQDVDVLVAHRKRHGDAQGPWEKAWNVWSRRTATDWFNSLGFETEFHPFRLPFDIPPASDPARTWTVGINGERRLLNGLKLIVDLEIMVARRPLKQGGACLS